MTQPVQEPERVELTQAQKKARRSRSVALALVLAAVVAIFYFVTIVKLGPSVFNRPL